MINYNLCTFEKTENKNPSTRSSEKYCLSVRPCQKKLAEFWSFWDILSTEIHPNVEKLSRWYFSVDMDSLT